MPKPLSCLMIASVVFALACNSSNRQTNNNSASVKPASDKLLPTAVEVGEVLKAGGLPFTYSVLDATGALDFLKHPDSPDDGIVSEANTATATMEVAITVFRSIEFRRKAKARMDAMHAKLHADEARGRDWGAPQSIEYYAECGTIMVYLQPDDYKDRKLVSAQATKAQAILKKHYKCD